MKKANTLSAILEHMGLKPKEAGIYLALLEIGEGSAQEIAEQAKTKRTTAYSVLEELRKKGFLFQAKRSGHTFFIPENPTAIAEDFKDTLGQYEKHQQELIDLFAKKRPKPRILFFNGQEGFKKIWRVIFSSGIKEYLIITDPEQMLGFTKAYYISNYIIKEKVRLSIQSRHLVTTTEYSKDVVKRDSRQNRTSKFLPHQYKVACTKIIFGNNVAIIAPAIENTIVIVESEAFAKTERALFEALWINLP